MDRLDPLLARTLARRRLLATGALGLAAGGSALAQSGKFAQLLMTGGAERRFVTTG